jgi:probable phosphomutase (TIGR03848 family)
MPYFLLIRHGENEYVKKGRLAGRLPDIHLNDKGRQEAKSVAEKLTGAPIKAIYSSPLERAMETAQPIAEALGLEVIQRPGLIETNYGDWTDQKIKGLSRLKLWKIVQNRPTLMQFPGGESFYETQVRITSELMGLARQFEDKDLLVCVSHADPIKLAVAYFIGLPLDMFQRLSISPGSITALNIGETGSQLLSMNIGPALQIPKS